MRHVNELIGNGPVATEDGLVLINDFLHRACKHERLGKENVALRAHYASGWPVISSYCYALDSRCEILQRFSQRLCPRSKRFVDSVITLCSSYIVFLHFKTADARQIELISISLFILHDYNLSYFSLNISLKSIIPNAIPATITTTD